MPKPGSVLSRIANVFRGKRGPIEAWLDSLRADAVYGWRQINKHKAASAAAILSLGLAMGACTAAFRLIDALFLRSLPVSDPQRLYVISRPAVDKPETAGSTCAFARCARQ